MLLLPLGCLVGCDADPERLPGPGEGDAGRVDAADLGGADAGGPGDLGGADLGASDGGVSCELADTAPELGLAVTALGPIRGAAVDGVYRYLGIPFAKPPVDARRWRAPEPTGCFAAELPALSFAADCPQYVDGEVEGEEDCLGLNVWSPVGTPDASPRPVLVFVHGGGHEQGSGSKALFDGSHLALEHGVVVVTFNYRLGPFGFLAHPDLPEPQGNYGTADQVAALRWVHAHIGAFGGDPERVVLFGESAGAVGVCRLLVSEPARGSFAAAIMQSGACVANPLADALASGTEFAEGIGCSDGDCLEAQDTAAIMAGFEPLSTGTNVLGSTPWTAAVDGTYLSDLPIELIRRGAQAPVPVIIGSNREENGLDAPPLRTELAYQTAVRTSFGAIYSEAQLQALLAAYPASDYDTPRGAYVAMTSDRRFTCPARITARVLARGEPPVYRYLFAQIPERAGPQIQANGAFHGIELTYVFGGIFSAPALLGPGDERVAEAIQRAWVGMADGAPPADLGWPADEGNGSVMLFEGGALPVTDPKGALCDVWESL